MIDFKAIKDRHRIEDYLAKNNVEVRRASGGFTAKCPFHDGDNKASLFIHASKQYATCYTRCGYIGSVLDVVMRWLGIDDVVEACERLEGRALTDEEKSRPLAPRVVPLRFEDTIAHRPLPKMFRAEQLKMGAEAAFKIIAKARGLDWTGIKLAHDHGCLRFCREHWEGENENGPWRTQDFDCYALLDVGNPCNVQFRRLDADETGKALPFWVKNGKPLKVLGRKPCKPDWPVGIDAAIAHPKATILLVEGTGDKLAGWDIRGLGHDVIPVGIFGAGHTINAQALPFFERRNVIIVQQHDAACEKAAARWAEQLATVHARQRNWLVPEEGGDLNDFISAGGDVEKIFNP